MRYQLTDHEWVAIKPMVMRPEFVPRCELERTFSEIASAMRQIVLSSKLDRASQDDAGFARCG
ncbi:MAG: hypothetical protein WB696_14045 [Chthoniobacterales bacterium]